MGVLDALLRANGGTRSAAAAVAPADAEPAASSPFDEFDFVSTVVQQSGATIAGLSAAVLERVDAA
jgi:hypothetical protein